MFAGPAALASGNVFWRARGDEFTTAITTFRTKVQHPVGGLHHIQIVLNDDNRVAGVDERVQDFQQLAYVLEMQARRRFVEDVERLARCPFGQFLGEFHALSLTA